LFAAYKQRQLLARLLHVCEEAKRNREIIPATKEHNGKIITETAEKAKVFNSYFAPVCFCDR